MDTEQLLASVSLFHKLDKKQIRALARLVKTQTYPADHYIVQQGQPGLGLYIIAEGRALVTQGTRTLRELGVGDFFGEMSLLDDLRFLDQAAALIVQLDNTVHVRLDVAILAIRFDFIEMIADVLNIEHATASCDATNEPEA